MTVLPPVPAGKVVCRNSVPANVIVEGAVPEPSVRVETDIRLLVMMRVWVEPGMVIGAVRSRLRAELFSAVNPLLRVTALATVRLAPAGVMTGGVAFWFMVTVPVPNGPEVIEPGEPTVLTPSTMVPAPLACPPIVVVPVYVLAPLSVIELTLPLLGLR